MYSFLEEAPISIKVEMQKNSKHSNVGQMLLLVMLTSVLTIPGYTF